MAANVDRYERNKIFNQFHQLCGSDPLSQAEQIAHHYLSNLADARDLAEFVKARRYSTPEHLAKLDEVIAHLVRNMKNRHAHDLGIPLDWPPLR